MTPAGGFHSFAPAPVKIQNRYAALEETNIIDSNGAPIFREKIVKIESLIKPTKPMKKSWGKEVFHPRLR
jgi:hypothetical protein